MTLEGFAIDLLFFISVVLMAPAALICGAMIAGSVVNMMISAVSNWR